MAFIKLEGISKIYSTGNAVAVGIQKVNLEFDRGEFVAITGKSGSGKTTLLNVMSGLDSFEEGELYIEGEETSHYTAKEWEAYRRKYISFIYQDYNIIESFTVLENVEFALMHIEDIKQRRAKAIELINRVGLQSSIKQKGSKLSGGQKQRTVIARALAKDSPIIFADEPTGNLDAKSSVEILKMLAEIGKDKLVIVVTHNSEQLAEYATREIRIYDGKIDSDTIIGTADLVENIPVQTHIQTKSKVIKDGFIMGGHKFIAQPKLSIFLCAIFLIAVMFVFAVSSLIMQTDNYSYSERNLFEYKDGRVVVYKQDDVSWTKQQAEEFAKKYNADLMWLDKVFDSDYLIQKSQYRSIGGHQFKGIEWNGQHKPQYGTAPIADNDIFLYLPIWARDEVMKGNIFTK